VSADADLPRAYRAVGRYMLLDRLYRSSERAHGALDVANSFRDGDCDRGYGVLEFANNVRDCRCRIFPGSLRFTLDVLENFTIVEAFWDRKKTILERGGVEIGSPLIYLA
jgi:hypothetical protein